MRKLQQIAAATAVFAGSLAFAAYALAAPLTYNNDTTVALTSPAINLTIKANSTADTVVVNAGTIVITVSGTEQFIVTSASQNLTSAVTNNTGNAAASLSCSSGLLTATINASNGSGTFTLTPTGSQCVASTPGGGGGGGATTPPQAPSQPNTTTGTVAATAAAGGLTTLTNSDGSAAQVNVPAGALSADSTVAVVINATAPVVASPTPSASLAQVGSYYNFTATQTGGANVTNFNSNVTLTFNYLLSQIPAGVAESSLQVYFFNTATNAWVLAGGTVNTTNHSIAVPTNHFTVFAIFGSAAAATPPSTPSLPAAPPPPGGPPVSPPAVTYPAVLGAHPNGALVLNSGTVYLIRNNQRMAFRSVAEYRSYGYSFSQVLPANTADLSLPATGILKAFDGTLALDTVDGRTIYMIAGGQKQGFTSAAVFTGLGYKFSQAVRINLADYSSAAPISSASAQHPNGALVKSGAAIWWILNGQLLPFPSMTVLNSYGFSIKNVLLANAADRSLPQGAAVLLRDGTLVKDGVSYYVISNGNKLGFASLAVLKKLGYKTSNAIKANLANYSAGAVIR